MSALMTCAPGLTFPSMMWKPVIEAIGPSPSSAPARIFTMAWLVRWASSNMPEKAMHRPRSVMVMRVSIDAIRSRPPG